MINVVNGSDADVWICFSDVMFRDVGRTSKATNTHYFLTTVIAASLLAVRLYGTVCQLHFD